MITDRVQRVGRRVDRGGGARGHRGQTGRNGRGARVALNRRERKKRKKKGEKKWSVKAAGKCCSERATDFLFEMQFYDKLNCSIGKFYLRIEPCKVVPTPRALWVILGRFEA